MNMISRNISPTGHFHWSLVPHPIMILLRIQDQVRKQNKIPGWEIQRGNVDVIVISLKRCFLICLVFRTEKDLSSNLNL